MIETNTQKESPMKFVCLGYHNEGKYASTPEAEGFAMMDECLTYDDELREKGHFADGHALQGANTAATLRWQDGKVIVTDGPYAETKEQIGGILILDAQDFNHAIQLMSKHPAIRFGTYFEIRPAADLTEMIRESEKRRSLAKG